MYRLYLASGVFVEACPWTALRDFRLCTPYLRNGYTTVNHTKNAASITSVGYLYIAVLFLPCFDRPTVACDKVGDSIEDVFALVQAAAL